VLAREITSLSVLGVPLHEIDAPGIVDFIDARLADSQRVRVLYANAHVLRMVSNEPKLATYFTEADIVACDGFGAAAAAYMMHGRRPPRQTPPDWIDLLASRAAARGYRMFLLGSTESASRKAAQALQQRHPTLQISGIMSGYFDKARGSRESQAVVEAINDAGTDILVIGFGVPAQEAWLWENWEALRCGAGVTVGAMFDFLSGEVYRAPRWVTDHGFEWASRLVAEPRRLWRRYLVGLPVLFGKVAAARLRRRSR
jgi:N-acetylglucosaminyldiphosphoundecaprenol N-acetyl-beta-D-mannosaminyltransferase